MKIGFDNEKYLSMQSEHIKERISKFDNKLYLEFGGKLFDPFSVVVLGNFRRFFFLFFRFFFRPSIFPLFTTNF